MKRILKKAKFSTGALGSDELRAIRSLKEKDTVVILEADKGAKKVVMDKSDYESKLNGALREHTVEEIKKDPTDSENRKLINVLKEIEKKKECTRIERLKITVKTPQCPVVYCLHKACPKARNQ